MIRSKLTYKSNGNSNSVTIHHAEQDWLEVLRKSKKFDFSASDDEVRNFLSEEEYLNVVLESEGKNITLSNVKRINVRKQGNMTKVTIGFRNLEENQ